MSSSATQEISHPKTSLEFASVTVSGMLNITETLLIISGLSENAIWWIPGRENNHQTKGLDFWFRIVTWLCHVNGSGAPQTFLSLFRERRERGRVCRIWRVPILPPRKPWFSQKKKAPTPKGEGRGRSAKRIVCDQDRIRDRATLGHRHMLAPDLRRHEAHHV